jgi:hypothetical protein
MNRINRLNHFLDGRYLRVNTTSQRWQRERNLSVIKNGKMAEKERKDEMRLRRNKEPEEEKR